jgi:hypothetical protein
MKPSMKVSNVNDVHFHVVQNALITFFLLIKIIVQFADIKLINSKLIYNELYYK